MLNIHPKLGAEREWILETVLSGGGHPKNDNISLQITNSPAM